MLSKSDIKRLLEFGKKYNATHLIIFYDLEEHDKSYRYAYIDNTVDKIIDTVTNDKIIVDSIYNYDIDFEEQLNEEKPMHDEPSKREEKLYEQALRFAAEKHNNQERKGSKPQPYIFHPINVSHLISKYMKDDDEKEVYKISAILHDTLEDTDATYEEEKRLFGKDISDIVLSVTNDKEEIEKNGKEIYLSKKMVEMNDKTLILKLCDRLDNVSGLKVVDEEFKERYIKETSFIINYLLLNRKLNDTHLKIINDIMKKIKEVSYKDPMILEIK